MERADGGLERDAQPQSAEVALSRHGLGEAGVLGEEAVAGWMASAPARTGLEARAKAVSGT